MYCGGEFGSAVVNDQLVVKISVENHQVCKQSQVENCIKIAYYSSLAWMNIIFFAYLTISISFT